ncbi:SDR family NAD(P)-dependent oxidoreductase [Gilvimarinus xylanilyticus]|uniref:SDR family oxidoreductase n=1 Tax=Gilvimarinus xylanilyticus TaxID=2944139 RepID=A0A9X2I550_9GAMM|nr:SDR family NAD(P)-dependent oxidoreductase [Gilvimarinus xylanilyticus]MCP8900545.1 SDR family oxidoreductase [Gilvimarinus xylanilyticus]
MSPTPERTLYPSLKGQTVFITGGATGIGACMVEAFLYQGCRVGFVDIAATDGKQLCREMEIKYPGAVIFIPCDVTDVPALRDAIQTVETELGTIAVLINNVANDKRCDPRSLSDESWHSSLAVNLDAAFFTTRAIAPGMTKRGGGSIINFSSINAVLGPAQMPSYVTAKAGLLGLTRALASDFASDNIRVNAIIPGWVATDKQLEKWLSPEKEAEWMDSVRLKRRLMPADVANMALFLASSDASMITGQQFVVDGGRL